MIKNLFKTIKILIELTLPDQQLKKSWKQNKKFTRKFVEQQATKLL